MKSDPGMGTFFLRLWNEKKEGKRKKCQYLVSASRFPRVGSYLQFLNYEPWSKSVDRQVNQRALTADDEVGQDGKEEKGGYYHGA